MGTWHVGRAGYVNEKELISAVISSSACIIFCS